MEPTTSGSSTVGDVDENANEESQEELVSMKKIIKDLNIDEVLEEKASKLNCSSKNVKSIIREVFTSKIFKKLMFNAAGKKKKKGPADSGGIDGPGSSSGEIGGDLVIDHDVSGASSDDDLYFEPKLTRAKARELLKSELNPSDKFGTSLLTMFSSPMKKITDSEIDLLVNHELAENDDDDEEYVPQENEKTDIDQSDDETCSLASHGTDTADNTSDYGSPRFSTPVPTRQRTRLRDELTNSLTKSSPRLAGKELFKPPLPKPLVFDKDDNDNDNDEPGISLRTRSKQPLTDTSIEKLEMNFIPPDISTDMYDWGGQEDDKDYLNFLHDFLFPTTSKNNETNDDEEADPEYNIMEDEEEHDKEELRVDRAVKVTKKELNILISELIDEVSFEEDIDYSNGGGEIKSIGNQSTSTSTSTQVTGPKKVTFQLPDDDIVKSILIHKPQDNKERQLEVWSATTTLTPLTTVQLSIPSPIPSIPCVNSSSNVVPQEYYINPLFTNTNYAILQDQMRRHIQLLTQGYVLLAPYTNNFMAKELSKKSKMMIGELSNLSRAIGSQSAFNVWNLEPAFKLISTWPPLPPTRNKDYKTPLKKRILEERTYNEMEFIENDINKIRTFSVPFIKLISTSPVFMYGELLPQSCNQTLLEKLFFLNSEDALIAYGLAGLKERPGQEDMTLRKKIHEIVQVLLPGRSEDNIYHRIKNLNRTFEMEGKKGKKIRTQITESPLYKFLANGEIPQPKLFTIPTREQFISPINKLSETLDSKWVTLINIYKKYQEQTVTTKKSVQRKTVLENKVERISSAKKSKKETIVEKNELLDSSSSKSTTINQGDLKLTRPNQPKPKKKRCKSKDVIMKTNLPSQNNNEITELKKDYPEMNAIPLHKAENGVPAIYALIPKHVILHQPIPPTSLLTAPKFQIRPLNLSPRKKFQFSEQQPPQPQIKNISPIKVPLECFQNSDGNNDNVISQTDNNTPKKSTLPTLVSTSTKKGEIIPEILTMTKISPPHNSPINLSKKLFFKSKSFPTFPTKPYTFLSRAESSMVEIQRPDNIEIFKKPSPALPIKISLKRLRANQILDLSVSTNKIHTLVENSSARTREFNKKTFEMLKNFTYTNNGLEEEENDEQESTSSIRCNSPPISEAGSENDYGYDCSIQEEDGKDSEEDDDESPHNSPKVLDFIELHDSDDEESLKGQGGDSANPISNSKNMNKNLPIPIKEEKEKVVLPQSQSKSSKPAESNEASSVSVSRVKINGIPVKQLAGTGGGSSTSSSDNNNSSTSSGENNNQKRTSKSAGNESAGSSKRMKTDGNDDDDEGDDNDKKNREKKTPQDKIDFDDEKGKEDGEIDSDDEEMDQEMSSSKLSSSSPSRFSGSGSGSSGKRGDKKLVTTTSSSSSKLKRSPVSASASASVSASTRTMKRPIKYKVTSMEKMLEENEVLEEAVDTDGAEGAHVLNYIQAIQSKVDPVAYDQFYNLMKEFANNETEQNSVELFYKVEKLFKNYPDIVKDFIGILRVEDAVEINRLMDFHESRAYIKFMGLLEKWTADCPQLKTRIIHNLKSLKEIGATEKVIIDTMEPLLKENILVFESFKVLFHSIPNEFPTRSIDFEEIDIEGIEEQQQLQHQTSTTTSPTASEAELVKLPDEKQIPATNTCPCTCHQEIHNISFKTRSKHCQKCSLKFQDGKILAHFGRIMKPVSVEYKSPSSSNSNSNINTPPS